MQLEVFLRIFHFIIQIQILNLDRLGTGWYQSGPVRPWEPVSDLIPTCLVNRAGKHGGVKTNEGLFASVGFNPAGIINVRRKL
jgi:hypothetical protein